MPFHPRRTSASARVAAALLGAGALALAALPGPTFAAAPGSVEATGTKQSARLLMHPQLVQPGGRVAAAQDAASAMSAVFRPVRQGREAQLQRRTPTGWVTVATRRQNGRGSVDFTAPYRVDGKVAKYRTVAPRHEDLPRVASPAARTDRWGPADFTDEFSGTTLGPDWSHRGQVYVPDSQRNCAKGDPSAVSVAEGRLRLSVLLDPERAGTTCTYGDEQHAWRLNGHIGTADRRFFKYGYAAARIRFQDLRGQHGAFWLMPQTRDAVEGPAEQTGTEIDVIEWFGANHPHGGLGTFLHHYPDDGQDGVTPRRLGRQLKDPDRFGGGWSERYHVFSVEWTPRRYVFRIDGQESLRIKEAVSGQPEYLVLSLLSSSHELRYLGGEENLPQHMHVDWVRYWDRDPGNAG